MLITSARKPYGCQKDGWACFLDDGETKCGHYVIEWIEAHCVYTQGKWIKLPVELLDWEKDYIIELFGINPEIGRRQYRWTLLGIPKKNGKTELAGWLGNYLLIGDEEPSPWVAVASAAEKQADLAFGAAKRCAQWSPTLSQVTERFGTEIQVPSLPGSKLMRLASKGGTNDGPSWHAVICDELHEWMGDAGRKLWTVLTNGIGSRDEPLVIQITTAGFDVDGTVCGEQYTLGLALAEDPDIDPRYLFWWYQSDDEADYSDPEVWKDANPSWGATLPDPEAYLRDQFNKKTESEFKRYFLNRWVLAQDIWLPDGAWKACEDETVSFSTDLPIFVGIDGALKRDTFAVTIGQKQEDKFVVQARVWENPYPRGHSLRSTWKLNMNEPINFLKALYMKFPQAAIIDEDWGAIPGPAFAYDPRFLEYAAQQLEGDGLNMIEVPQTDERMCPASEHAYRLIMEEELVHNGDVDLRRHVHAGVPIEKARGWRVGRPKTPGAPRKPIDGLIGLILAVSVAYQPEIEEEEEIDGDGLL